MTYIERIRQEHPDEINRHKGLPNGCPCDYGYELEWNCAGVNCTACWNREAKEEKETC